MIRTSNSRYILILVVVCALLLALQPAAAQSDDGGADCPLGQGYWLNNPDVWPVDSMTLGGQTYTQEELLLLLGASSVGDASLILARQLIAARLNGEAGADSTVVDPIIAQMDALLATFDDVLPYNVAPSSPTGQSMVIGANTLDVFNSGILTEGCADDSDDDPEATPEATTEPGDDDDDDFDGIIIIIEGPVRAIQANIIVIYQFNIVLQPDDPNLTVIRIGDVIRVEGALSRGDDDDDDSLQINVDGTINIVIISINITFINVQVFINTDGRTYRNDNNCNNPPPDWAPAIGWRRRCQTGGDSDDDDDDD